MNRNDYPLPPSQYKLLLRLINSRRKQTNKFYDSYDNCFYSFSYRKLAELSGESKSSLNRLFNTLSCKGLAKKVTNNAGDKVYMLNPNFLCCKSKWQKLFMIAMYKLESYDLACLWGEACRWDYQLYDLNTFHGSEIIDFETGEIIQPKAIRKLSHNEVLAWKAYINSYSSTDRTKQRMSKKQRY